MVRPHFHLKLTPEEKQALENFVKAMARAWNHRGRARGWALLASNDGWTIREICHLKEISPRTLRNWLRRFRQGGVAALYARPRPRRLTLTQEGRLLEYSRRPELFQLKAPTKIRALRRLMPTYRQLAQWVSQNYGVRLSTERVRQIVRQRLCRPSGVNFKKDL